MREQIDGFLTYIDVSRHFAANTLSAYRNDLDQFVTYLEDRGVQLWSAVDAPTFAGYVAYLKDRGYRKATVARKVAATKSFFNYLVTTAGVLAADPSEAIKPPEVGKRKPLVLERGAIDRLLAEPSYGTGAKALRDVAIMEVLYATGMRVSELVALNTDDVNLASGTVRCFGKGGKERIIPMPIRAVDALAAYLDEGRVAYLRKRDERALFLNLRGTRLTRQGLWLIIKGYVEAAGIEGEVTPHTLRHSFARHLLDDGAAVREVQRLLGHSNLSTTQIYTERASSAPEEPRRAP